MNYRNRKYCKLWAFKTYYEPAISNWLTADVNGKPLTLMWQQCCLKLLDSLRKTFHRRLPSSVKWSLHLRNVFRHETAYDGCDEIKFQWTRHYSDSKLSLINLFILFLIVTFNTVDVSYYRYNSPRAYSNATTTRYLFIFLRYVVMLSILSPHKTLFEQH